MNQIAHIIRKDLRHLRSLLLVWLGLLILQAVLTGGVHPFIDDIRTMDLLSNFVPLLSLMEFLLLTVIIAQLIQADSLVGSTAFWLTLPISRGGLLASKSILLVLFVILPTLLVEVVLHFANGITVFDVFRSIPQILIFPLLLTAIPMLLASLTPEPPQIGVLRHHASGCSRLAQPGDRSPLHVDNNERIRVVVRYDCTSTLRLPRSLSGLPDLNRLSR